MGLISFWDHIYRIFRSHGWNQMCPIRRRYASNPPSRRQSIVKKTEISCDALDKSAELAAMGQVMHSEKPEIAWASVQLEMQLWAKWGKLSSTESVHAPYYCPDGASVHCIGQTDGYWISSRQRVRRPTASLKLLETGWTDTQPLDESMPTQKIG